MATDYAAAVSAHLPKSGLRKIETIITKTGLVGAQVRRQLTKIAASGEYELVTDAKGTVTGVRKVKVAAKPAVKTKSKIAPRRKMVEWTPARVKAEIDAAAAKQDGVKIGEFVKTLVDNHRFNKGDEGSVTLIRQRRFLYRNESLTGSHIQWAYDALCNYLEPLAKLLTAKVGGERKWIVRYTDATGIKGKTKEITAASIGMAVVAARKGVQDFHLESVDEG